MAFGFLIAVGKLILGAGISYLASQEQAKRAKRAANRASRALSASSQRSPTEVRSARAARQYGVGIFRNQTAMALIAGKDSNLDKIGVINAEEIGDAIDFVVDGKIVQRNSGAFVINAPYTTGTTKWMSIGHRNGDDDNNGDYSGTIALFGPDDVWTSDHRLAFLATVQSRMRAPAAADFPKVFPNGENTAVTVICRSRPIADPRTPNGWDVINPASNDDKIRIAQNAALCIAAHLRHPARFNLPSSVLDTQSFINRAGLDDEFVFTVTGSSRRRWKLSGSWDGTQSNGDSLRLMLDSCDAVVYQTTEGKIAIAGGQYIAPDLTITDEDGIFEITSRPGVDVLDRTTVAVGEYYGPEFGYAVGDFGEVVNSADSAKYGRRVADYSLPFAPDFRQAKVAAKIKLAEDNPELSGEIRMSIVGFKAMFPPSEGHHVLRVNSAQFGFDKIVRVLSGEITPEGETVIKWQSIDPTVYDRDPAIEESIGPTPIADLGVPSLVLYTPELEPQPIGAEIVSIPSGGQQLRLQFQQAPNFELQQDTEVSWTDPNDPLDPAIIPETNWDGFTAEGTAKLVWSVAVGANDAEFLVRFRYRQSERGQFAYVLIEKVGNALTVTPV